MMNRRKTLATILLIIAILMIIGVPVWLFTPLGANVLNDQADLNAPPLTPLAFTPASRTVPQAVLTPKGTPNPVLASEAILMDADTGNVLYEKQAENPVPMASTTKIMTALLAIQSGNLDQMVTIGQDAPTEVSANGGSSAHLVVGDQITLRDLLYGLMLPSGDDAAVAVADAVAGSPTNFVHIMNVEAEKLHLYQTHFDNVDGLQPTDNQGNPIFGLHYTTAYDLARLARYAMRLPLLAQIVQQKEFDLPASGTHHAYIWKTTNKLLGVYQGMLGIKTGTTPWAGECLVFAAKQNGHTLIGVILHSATDASRFKEAQTMLNWGFALPVQVPQM